MRRAIGAAKISSRFQVVLPQEVREKLDAKAGNLLLFFENEQGEIVVTVKV